MNPFEHIVDIKEAAEKYSVTTDYLGRILKGTNPFPADLIEGVDYKLFGRVYIVSESGLKKLNEGFEAIRNKGK